MWSNFVRKPEFKERERYFCVVAGREEFRMVSPIYKQAIYSGVLDEIPPQDTPIDFFGRIDRDKFPLFKGARVLRATLNKGQCIYVPAYFWVQTSTVADRTIMLTFEYEAHSELTSLLFKAIDQGILED